MSGKSVAGADQSHTHLENNNNQKRTKMPQTDIQRKK